MRTRGRIRSVTVDSMDLKPVLSIELADRTGVEELRSDIIYEVVLSRLDKKRSLDANAYAWKLMGELGRKTGISASDVYEEFLRDNPIFYEDEDGFDIRFVLKGKKIRRQEHEHWFHLQDYQVKGKGGKTEIFSSYARLKGTSRYTREEMSHLIEQIVAACRDEGIPTMPPEEYKAMLEKWKPKKNEVDIH